MFKLIKLAIALCLIMGVVFLGAKIQNKSSEMELDLAEEKSVVQEKIAELKKEALNISDAEPLDMNRITEIRNIYSKALETLNLR